MIVKYLLHKMKYILILIYISGINNKNKIIIPLFNYQTIIIFIHWIIVLLSNHF
jgi:hypothetical protein